MEARRVFVRGLPKAELHVHLEGTLEPEMMFELAARNGMDIPFQSVKELRAAYNFSDLQAFLDIYYQGAQVLCTDRDFYDLTKAYLAKAHAEGVVHAEMFFDPQTHLERGVSLQSVIEGIQAACDEAANDYGMTSGLIMCFLRDRSEEEALETLKAAEPYLSRIMAVGLDSAERGHPPSKFSHAFQRARDAGLRAVAHAGEEGPADYVWEALDLLKVQRVDHGNAAMTDSQLVDRLVEKKVPLTVCPLSNRCLRVVETLEAHPLKQMLERGLRATVNSDDPAYFGGYLVDNYVQTAEAVGLSILDLVTLAKNSILGSFLDQETKNEHMRKIDAHASQSSRQL